MFSYEMENGMRHIAAEFRTLNMRRNVQINKGETEIHHLCAP